MPLGQDTADADMDGGAGTAHGALPQLAVPDHYFLAYQDYVRAHQQEPKGGAAFEELSRQLAAAGIYGSKGRPVSPSTLRRYALEQRIYRRWAHERERRGGPPSDEVLLQRLLEDGVTAGDRRPAVGDIERAELLASGFERRYQALGVHRSAAGS
ncbi:hypothetical protein [Streptomyces sp. NPDC048425]|uniref:hypothetical protein n=1 Tax=Streptomyces sp. NPDC048425 TaxID=3365548 RepID=UPI003712DB3D